MDSRLKDELPIWFVLSLKHEASYFPWGLYQVAEIYDGPHDTSTAIRLRSLKKDLVAIDLIAI